MQTNKRDKKKKKNQSNIFFFLYLCFKSFSTWELGFENLSFAFRQHLDIRCFKPTMQEIHLYI